MSDWGIVNDELNDPANWPDGAPWLTRGFASAADERADAIQRASE